MREDFGELIKGFYVKVKKTDNQYKIYKIVDVIQKNEEKYYYKTSNNETTNKYLKIETWAFQ